MYRIPNPFGDEVVLRSIDWLENLPWKHENGVTKDFEVNIDLRGFAPSEIKVKVSDGFIVIEAAHDERRDNDGYISRRLFRRCPLPDDCMIDRVESRLSANGILTVRVPRKVLVKDNTVIPVIVEGSSVKSKL